MDTRLIQIFERDHSIAPSRKAPKKRERIIQPESDSDDGKDDKNTSYSNLLKSNQSHSNSTDKDKINKNRKSSLITSSGTNSSSTVPPIKLPNLTVKLNQVGKSSHSNGSSTDNSRTKLIETKQKAPTVTTLHRKVPLRIIDDSDTSSSGSSSDDQPLSQTSNSSKKRVKEQQQQQQQTQSQQLIGTKRKAEVLSKESGKIGVTIKTSPDGPPPAKILCTNVSATPITVPVKNEPAPLSPETPASHPESNIPPEKPSTSSIKNELIADAGSQQIPSIDISSSNSLKPTIKQENRDHDQIQNNRIDNSTDNVNNSKIQNEFKQEKRVVPIPTSPRPAPPRLWLPKCNLSDQIIITDVTVNKETVTIRECKMEAGFFQPRNEPFTQS